jgi:hypothetical protein
MHCRRVYRSGFKSLVRDATPYTALTISFGQQWAKSTWILGYLKKYLLIHKLPFIKHNSSYMLVQRSWARLQIFSSWTRGATACAALTIIVGQQWACDLFVECSFEKWPRYYRHNLNDPMWNVWKPVNPCGMFENLSIYLTTAYGSLILYYN